MFSAWFSSSQDTPRATMTDDHPHRSRLQLRRPPSMAEFPRPPPSAFLRRETGAYLDGALTSDGDRLPFVLGSIALSSVPQSHGLDLWGPEPRSNRRSCERFLGDAEDCYATSMGDVEDVPIMAKSKMLTKLMGVDLAEVLDEEKTTFRIFVSCAGSDTEWERSVLMTDVYPFVRQLCHQIGMELHVIDLRWGADDGLFDDHMQEEFCLNEISRCFQLSAGPAYVALLGDKCGSRPPPRTIDAEEFENMLMYLRDVGVSPDGDRRGDYHLLMQWYIKDKNCRPGRYVLQRVGAALNVNRPQDSPASPLSPPPAGERAWKMALDEWKTVSPRLVTVLREGALCLTVRDERKYFVSSLEKEIFKAAFHSLDGLENMEEEDVEKEISKRFFCFQRSLSGFDSPLFSHPVVMNTYFDTKLRGNSRDMIIDEEARQRIYDLRERVPFTSTYTTHLRLDDVGFDPRTDPEQAIYLRTFCDELSELLCTTIIQRHQLMGQRQLLLNDPLIAEVAVHRSYATELCASYIGVGASNVDTVGQHISESTTNTPLWVYGPDGFETACFVAKCIHDISLTSNPAPLIVYRFGGLTMSSRTLPLLLRSICSQIRMCNSDDSTGLPDSLEDLSEAFVECLKTATEERPIVIVVGCLDNVYATNQDQARVWIPKTLPPHATLILSQASSDRKGKAATQTAEGKSLLVDFDTDAIIGYLKDQSGRDLTDEQVELLRKHCQTNTTGQYIRGIWEIASQWQSNQRSADLEPTLPASASNLMGDILRRMEDKYGSTFVMRTLSYLAVAKRGLSVIELEDLLSCDDRVLNDVYKNSFPRVCRIPQVILFRFISDMEPYFIQRMFDRTRVLCIRDPEFHSFVAHRYLTEGRQIMVCRRLVAYFEGTWCTQAKPYEDAFGRVRDVRWRHLADQPFIYSVRNSLINHRKMSNLVGLQLASGRYRDAVVTLDHADFKMAVKYVDQDVRLLLAEHTCKIGLAFKSGSNGLDQDVGRSKAMIQKSAADGCARAQIELGLDLARDGSEAAKEQARKWLAESERHPRSPLEYYLTAKLLKMLAAEGDQDQSVIQRYLELAAKGGSVEAQLQLASNYTHGLDGCSIDSKLALQYYLMAGKQGDSNAQYQVGCMYRWGMGVDKDEAEGVHWFEMAAKGGSAVACEALGTCYASGKGTDADPSKAMEYYQTAIRNGHSLSKQAIQKMAECCEALSSQLRARLVQLESEEHAEAVAASAESINNGHKSTKGDKAAKPAAGLQIVTAGQTGGEHAAEATATVLAEVTSGQKSEADPAMVNGKPTEAPTGIPADEVRDAPADEAEKADGEATDAPNSQTNGHLPVQDALITESEPSSASA
ncbi:uncharacterized protein BJ171DRAFT_439956 [Polychytrium aggregatum]|uniref:uncharacterized protein n=1 Tax=Polychytrium aggregatum TaxID=110093 RepID=UPI0022FE8EF3|nr:uncharacterized protein BJ171DRAFT_439956 [Polychytrium aggregatum]KAI9207055.1 hypothetical protein BJ171DRAFT_439956 [Polychytrium aggregatum]